MSELAEQPRRARRTYALSILGVLVVLTALSVPLIRSSDVWNTHHRVAQEVPVPAVVTPLPDSIRAQWSTSDNLAPLNSPIVGGTVVIANEHGLSGRDPTDNHEVWQYRRTNTTLCGWINQNGLVIAAFGDGDKCDDLIALRGDSGERVWYRNVDQNNLTLVDGRQNLQTGQQVLLVASSTKILALDWGTGVQSWEYQPPGCTLSVPVAGEDGVAVLKTCGDQPPQLVLHELSSDQERWSVALAQENPTLLAAHGQILLTAGPDNGRQLLRYDTAGAVVPAIVDDRLTGTDVLVPIGDPFNGKLVVWQGGNVHMIDLTAGRILWTAPTTGAPLLDGQNVLIPDRTGLTERDHATGTQKRHIAISDASSFSPQRMSRVGAHLIAESSDGVTSYR